MTLTQLVVDGATRRGHLVCLIAVETLRDVGFSAAELLASVTLPSPSNRRDISLAEKLRRWQPVSRRPRSCGRADRPTTAV